MGAGVLPAADAWNAIGELLENERLEFLSEPPGIDSILPALLRYPVPAGKLVADTYLTLDLGFQQFVGWNWSYLLLG